MGFPLKVTPTEYISSNKRTICDKGYTEPVEE